MIFPYKWAKWICMRTELYGIYMTDNMCAAADGETVTARECRGDRNCSLNADCKPLTNDSIIKTGRCGDVKTFRCEKFLWESTTLDLYQFMIKVSSCLLWSWRLILGNFHKCMSIRMSFFMKHLCFFKIQTSLTNAGLSLQHRLLSVILSSLSNTDIRL